MSERGIVRGLPSPFPIGELLPALYQADDFAQRFTQGLDEVLSPVLCALDCLDSYLDPLLAPSDFVAWLATWVGVALDENWPLERQREVITQAVELYRWRGTHRGIVEVVRLYVGVAPEVTDTGGVAVSSAPGADFPGEFPPSVHVELRVADPSEVDAGRVTAIVAAAKPAHVLHHVTVSAQ